MTVTDPDGEDDDEGLALGSIFTVSRKVFLFMSHVNRYRAVLYCTTGMGLWLWGMATGASSSTIARTDNRSI